MASRTCLADFIQLSPSALNKLYASRCADITPSARLDVTDFATFTYGIIQMLVVSSSVVKKEVTGEMCLNT